METKKTHADIHQVVKDRYETLACSSDENQPATRREMAAAFGYSPVELANIPGAANLGVGCGNPTAMASLKAGEVVVDLGCGGGLDVFLAAQKIGPAGKAIGIDMTGEVLARARKNAEQAGLPNVQFQLAQIEDLPQAEASVDCIISNCVLNLVPDKARAFAEISRVLKPGGRLAVSDIALKQPLPEELVNDYCAYIGCLAGAILIDDYRAGLQAAGFEAVEIIDSGLDLSVYAKLGNQMRCAKAAAEHDLFARFKKLLERFDVNQYAASVKVFALKPAA